MKSNSQGNELSLREVFSTLTGSIREFKGKSVLTPILVTGEVIIECIIPFVTASLIDAISAGAGMDTIYRYSAILVGLALLSLGLGTAAGVTCSIASTGFARNLRHDMFESIQGFSFSNINKFSTSSLVTRLTTDTNNVQQAFMMLIRMAVRTPLMSIFAIVMAFVTAGPMAVIYIVVALFLAAGLLGIAVKVMPIFRRVFKKYDALNDSVEENIKGIRVVKSYVREDHENEKFDSSARNIYNDFVKAERILALNAPVMTLAIDVVYLFIVFFGSKAIIESQGQVLNVGSMSALVTYGFSMLISLMMLSMVIVMITMSEESARRICEVLVEKSDLTNPPDPIMEVPDGSIDFDGVGFKYSAEAEHRALKDIDLHIKSGEVIGIIGGTGSSKSTLVQLISRLYDPTEGTVRVGGHDVREYDLETLRNQVAMVLQRNVLFSGTIKENLRWGDANATDEQLVEACKLAQADEFIQGFPDGYDTYIEQGGTNVSGGQKQRLCIARALLKRPKILILDDSTSAVDTKTDGRIREGFRSFIPSTTKLIIAQRTSSVKDADRIVVMDKGEINDIGTPDELLERNAIYREIYLSQNKESHDEKMEELEHEHEAAGVAEAAVEAAAGKAQALEQDAKAAKGGDDNE